MSKEHKSREVIMEQITISESNSNTFQSMRKKLIGSTCMSLLLLSLFACSGGSVDGNSAANNTADFDGEVSGYQAWSIISPTVEAGKTSNGFSTAFPEVVGTDKYSCISENFSMTQTPREFVAIDPDHSIMWLGNLIQGRSHLQVGSLQELPIRERATLNISIDLLRGDNTRRVKDPSLTSVNKAIGELVENAVNAGHEASTNVYFESKEAHSSSQASLDLGFSAEYLGSSAEASLSVDKLGKENTLFAYFIQKAFTVSMELPAAPQDLVSDAFTQPQLDNLIEKDYISENNPPLYISSMSYGRVLIYKMTSTDSVQRIQAAINASYSGITGGGSGYSEVDLQKTLSTAKIKISAFGGNQSNIEAMIRSGQLKDYFAGDTKLTSMQPISFEIRNLQDNTIAKISRTTEYDVKQCTYDGKTTQPIGEEIKLTINKVYIKGDCDPGINKGDIYGRFDIISYDNISDSRITRRIRTIKRSRPIKVQSGNFLYLGNAIKINKYYGKPFEISAQLKDSDDGAGGADDLVGNWNANTFDISRQAPKSYSKLATSNCTGDQPRLYYRLERLGYLY